MSWRGLQLNTATEESLKGPILPSVKSHCRVEHTHDDAYLKSLIDAALGKVEGPDGIGRVLLSQTWTLTLDEFPDDERIDLLLEPVASVSAVRYIDTDGDEQTLDAADYRLVTTQAPAFLEPVYGGAWPAIRTTPAAVTIDFVAGAASVAGVPADLLVAVRMTVAHWYEHREAVVTGTIATPMPEHAAEILDRYRVGHFAA